MLTGRDISGLHSGDIERNEGSPPYALGGLGP
jgi:hypothetical protein